MEKSRSLQELEGQDWSEATFGSHLVSTCHELRRKAIGSFEVEDLRIMIGQEIGLNYLIPLALEILEDDIFAEGSIYSGDLLDAVLRVDKKFWRNNLAYRKDLENMLERNINDLKCKLSSFSQESW